MTGHAMKVDNEHCLQAGMDAYLAKPVRGLELFSTIESLVGAAAGPESEPESDHGGNGVLDWSVALENVDQDRDLLRDVTAAFVEECPQMAALVESSIAAGDGTSLSRAAHTLKGGMRMFGASAPMEVAAKLEATAGQGDVAAAAEIYAGLKPMLAEVMQELKAFVANPESLGGV